RPRHDARLGLTDRRPAHHHDRGTDRWRSGGLHRQMRHQSRRMRRHPRPPRTPHRRPDRAALPRACAAAEGPIPPPATRRGLRLDQWAHMLGFRGPFSTKSRHYSTTLGALRAARIDHNRAHHDQPTTGRLPLTPEDEVLVVAHWRYLGQGLTPGEALLAAAL